MSSANDYYSVLRRAITAAQSSGKGARAGVYERARQAITDAQLPALDDAREQSALDAAIARIEEELSGPRIALARGDAARTGARQAARRWNGSPARSFALSGTMVAALTCAAILLVAIASYALWPQDVVDARGGPGKADGRRLETASGPPPDERSEPARSYIYNRQMVYYRSIHPIGTVVIAKSQRFLYLIRPNVAALRYSLGIGRECASVVGLLPVSNKEDWPERPVQAVGTQSAQAPNTRTSRSRFGTRSLALGDTGHRIHGTYAPTTDGDEGCFVLVNDDIVDLYERVPVGTRVVIN